MQGFYRTGIVVFVAMLVVCMVLAGCGKKSQQQQVAPEVAIVVMKHEQVSIITELPGRTSAYLVAEVRPQVSGIVKKRLFTEGSNVKAGEMLYQIDPAPYQAAYDTAKASLARAEANLTPARLRAERYKELVAVKAVSQQEYDDVSAALLQAEADVKYWKAAVESARINLGYTSITAPITGRAGISNVTVGALATANQPLAFTTIQRLDPIYVDATQSSANLLELKRKIESGQIKGDGPEQARVKLLLEDGSPYPQEGTLKFSDVTVDPSTGSFILRMVFPNPRNTLLPGMYVRALVQEGIADKAILVPQQAVTLDPKGNPVVLAVDAEGKVQQKMIITDRAIEDKWLVTSGLSPGDKVIVEGVQKVRPGVPVKVVYFQPGLKNAEAPVKTDQPSAKQVEPTAKTTEPSEKASKAPAKTDQPPAKPADPPAKVTQPPAKIGQSPAKTTELPAKAK